MVRLLQNGMVKNMDNVIKFFELTTGLDFDTYLERFRKHYQLLLFTEKKCRAKKKYLRRYFRRSSDNLIRLNAVQLSKDAVTSPLYDL